MTKITGYRELTHDDISRINLCKSLEVAVAEQAERIRQHINPTGAILLHDHPDSERLRQLAIARTEFEGAFMRLSRAIARPLSQWEG